MTEAALEPRLFALAGTKQGHRRQVEPDWAAVHRELKRKHVTLAILWDEYIERNPEGYRYSRFCELYRNWEGKLSLTMRQTHVGGDKLFVDYAGDTVPVIVDRLTGETRQVQIFVAVLGASNFTYAEATWSPGAVRLDRRPYPRLCGDRRRAASRCARQRQGRRHQGLPVRAAGQPDLCGDGGHYGTAVLPTRPRRPRDKAKVEVACKWSSAGFWRGCAIGSSTASPNSTPRLPNCSSGSMRKGHCAGSACTRRQLFEELDRPALTPLPIEPYVFAQWRVCRVGIDYHVEVERHFYSVPYRFARAEVEARLTSRTVEIFVKGERIAVHRAEAATRRHTTVTDHMPSSHRRYADWTIDRIRRDATLIGPATAALCDLILERRPHPEQGFRSCLGILRLARPFGVARLEAAAARAIEIGALTYGSVRSILDHKLDRQAAYQRRADGTPIVHPNIRGSRYYH